VGWWGEGVMEGDTPCDVELTMEEAILGQLLHDIYDNDGKKAANKAVKLYAERLKDPVYVQKAIAAIDTEDEIEVQALGYVIMAYGGTIEPIRAELLQAIASDDSSSWRNASARQRAMTNFRRRVNRYTGNRRSQARIQRGLLQAIGEALSTETSGLVNCR
jgi:hypothetical protein